MGDHARNASRCPLRQFMDHGGCDAATLAMRKRVIGDFDFAGLIRLGFEGTQTERPNLSFDALRRPKSAPALITRRVCHLEQNVGKSGTKLLPRDRKSVV